MSSPLNTAFLRLEGYDEYCGDRTLFELITAIDSYVGKFDDDNW